MICLMIRNDKILNSAPVRALHSGDDETAARLVILFLKFLTYCASNSWISFRGPDWISGCIGASHDDALRLWNVCVDTGVLQIDECGRYDADKWLHDNRYIEPTDPTKLPCELQARG